MVLSVCPDNRVLALIISLEKGANRCISILLATRNWFRKPAVVSSRVPGIIS
jgi:hypothetical protein